MPNMRGGLFPCPFRGGRIGDTLAGILYSAAQGREDRDGQHARSVPPMRGRALCGSMSHRHADHGQQFRPGYPVTMHWLQELHDRLSLWRHGDRYHGKAGTG